MQRQVLLFGGVDSAGYAGMWRTDGSAAGTRELTGINGAFDAGLFATLTPDFTPFNGKVLFAGTDAESVLGLWITNGTAAGTHELAGISGANANGVFFNHQPELAAFNGQVLFSGTNVSGVV